MRYDIDKVKRARLVRGWTKAELARRIQKKPSTITQIEQGVFSPLPTTMKRIAEELGLKMEDLILEEGNESAARNRYRMPRGTFVPGHAKKLQE